MRGWKRKWLGALLAAGWLLLTGAPAAADSTVIYSARSTCRDMALTYDVEFGTETQRLVNTIDSLGIRTTWFFLGDSVKAYPAIVKQVAARHQIGNHTYDHEELPRLSRASMRWELEAAERNIIQVSGVSPRPFFRPPYGSYNSTVLEVAEEMGYPYTFMWSIDTVDWARPSAETIRARITGNAHPGAIVLMHGHPYNTAEGTRLAVGDLKARGYQFVTLSEILGWDRHVRDWGGETYVIQTGDTWDAIGACHNVAGPRLKAYSEGKPLEPDVTLTIPRKGEILVRVNGVRQAFPVYPRLEGGASVAHVRLAEQLGAMVEWDGASVHVRTAIRHLVFTPGQRTALVDGSPVELGVAPMMVENRVLVPVRFLAEQLGYAVGWDAETWTALISERR